MKRIFLIPLVILLVLPKIFSATQEVSYSFTFSSIALSEDALIKNRIDTYPFKAPGSFQGQADEISVRVAPTSLLAIASSVTGMSVNTLTTLPISGLVLLLLSYVLAKRFLRSKLLAIAFALFISYESTVILLTNRLFYISLGLIMFFSFLIVFFKIQDGKPQRKYVPLLLLFFVVAYLSYYTAEFYIIGFLVLVSLADLIARKFKWRLQVKSASFLTLTFVLIFVGFDSAFYIYLERSRFASALEYINHLLGNLTGARTGSVVYFRSSIMLAMEFALLLSLLIPVSIYLLWSLIVLLRKRQINTQIRFDYRTLASFAIALTGFVSGLIYVPLGFFDFKYIYLLFPLLTLFSVECFLSDKSKTKTIIIILLLLIPMSKLGVVTLTEEGGYGGRYITAMSPSAKWSSMYTSEGRILTDTETGGILLVEFVQVQKASNVPICLFTERNIIFLYNLSKPNESAFRNYDYLILTRRITKEQVLGGSWANFRPAKSAFCHMDNLLYSNRIYDGGEGVIYRLNIPRPFL